MRRCISSNRPTLRCCVTWTKGVQLQGFGMGESCIPHHKTHLGLALRDTQPFPRAQLGCGLALVPSPPPPSRPVPQCRLYEVWYHTEVGMGGGSPSAGKVSRGPQSPGRPREGGYVTLATWALA